MGFGKNSGALLVPSTSWDMPLDTQWSEGSVPRAKDQDGGSEAREPRGYATGSSDDPELVARIRVGDEAAFQQLFDRYFPALATFAYRYTQSVDAAEDIVHDIFLSVWRRRAEWAPEKSVALYLFGAVHHLVLRHGRREARILPYSEELPYETNRENRSPDEDITYAELARAYERAIGNMPERMRMVYTLSREQRKTYAEIAEILGISVKTVETQMGRALARLRKVLAPFL
jgi:RNA polymerase sigma-70 factor (ECF subfamily)